MKGAPAGIVVATLTPFDDSGQIEEGALARHVEWLIAAGARSLAPAGTTGEGLYLSPAEAAALTRATVYAAAGRAEVIAGIWSLTIECVQWLARMAEESGADGLFLTTPIYYPAGDQAILEWYRAAREASGLPLYAYNIPQYAANRIAPDVFRRLLDEGTVAGIKDSTGREESLAGFLGAAGGRGAVYGASDAFALQARRMGAHGFISALANIFPAELLRIWGEDELAQQRMEAVRSIVKEYGGIGALKALVPEALFSTSRCRLPFSRLSPEDAAAVRARVTAVAVGE